MLISELKDMAEERTSFKGKTVTFSLHSTEIPAEHVIASMADYLNKNKNHQAVHLVLQGEAVGYITREKIYECAKVTLGGVGSGDGSNLPGPPTIWNFIELHCPTLGCDQKMVVTLYNQISTAICPRHKCIMVRT